MLDFLNTSSSDFSLFLTYDAPMIKSELRSAPSRKTASATLPVQNGNADLSAPADQSTPFMLWLLGSITAYSPVAPSHVSQETPTFPSQKLLTNQDGMISVVMIKEVELADEIVGARVLVVVEGHMARHGFDRSFGCNDGDVGVSCSDGGGEHWKTVCRVTCISSPEVVFVTNL
jgi:hypothetical protein